MKPEHFVKPLPPRSGYRYRYEVPECVNEAVNFDLGCIFVAIPKTGTTSVRDQIRPAGRALVPEPHLNILQIRDSIYVFLLRQALGRNRSFPGGEAYSDAELRRRSREIFESSFKFSSVRNPWARVVSMYFRREGVKMAATLSFEDFCEQHVWASDTCKYPTQHRTQLEWLVDEEDRPLVDYVYKVEEMERAFEEIRELTQGRLVLKENHLNRNPESQSQKYREMYNDHTRALIARRFERDVDTFKYVF